MSIKSLKELRVNVASLHIDLIGLVDKASRMEKEIRELILEIDLEMIHKED